MGGATKTKEKKKIPSCCGITSDGSSRRNVKFPSKGVQGLGNGDERMKKMKKKLKKKVKVFFCTPLMTAGDNICMWGEGKRRNREEESWEKISAGVIEKSCSAVSGVLDVRYTDIFFFFFPPDLFQPDSRGAIWNGGKVITSICSPLSLGL